MSEKSSRGGAKMSTSTLPPGSEGAEVWITLGGITQTEGEAQRSCSSSRQSCWLAVHGQRKWCMYHPSSASEHCSKSSWWCGESLVTSRSPCGGKTLIMKVVQRKILPKRPSWSGTSRL